MVLASSLLTRGLEGVASQKNPPKDDLKVEVRH